MSREHFSVDGTLLEACASLKSFRPKDEDDEQIRVESHSRHLRASPATPVHRWPDRASTAR